MVWNNSPSPASPGMDNLRYVINILPPIDAFAKTGNYWRRHQPKNKVMKKIFKTSKWSWQLAALLAGTWLFTSTLCIGQGWTTFDMPMFKNHHSAIAASNGKIYLFGGGATASDCTNEVYEFNPADGSFTLKAPMPGPRCGAAVEEWNGKIYLFGGYTEFIGTATNTVFEYDIANNSFQTLNTPMPTTRGYASASRLNDTIFVTGGAGDYASPGYKVVEKFYPKGPSWLPAGATLVNTRGAHTSHTIGENIYVLCGTPSMAGPLHTTIEKYHPNTGNWLVEESGVTARAFHSSCAAGQKIYIMGGYNGPLFSSVDVYNPTGTPRWETLDTMNTPRRGFAAASVPINGSYRIYAFGGNGYGGMLKTAEYYDVKTTWTLTTDMPVLKNHHSAITASNGKIYLFGGGVNTDVCTNEVYEFNPADSSFTLKAPIPGNRCGAAVEEVNGKIYLFGGWIDQFGGLASNSVYKFDPNNNGGTWTTLANMSTKRANASATKLNDNKIYVIGGTGDYGMNPSKAVEVFDPAGGNWLSPAPSLLKTRGGHVSHEVNGKIYVMGGVASLLESGAEKTVEMWDPGSGSGWVVVDSIPTPRLFLSSCKGLLDDKIYAIGGYNYGVGPALSSVDVFNPNGSEWETIDPMNVARRGFAAACVPIPDPGKYGYRIISFGGNNESGVLKSVEYIDFLINPSHEVKKVVHFDPQLRVFPNPACGMTTILYNLPASGEVQISLYDNYGRLVSTLLKAKQHAGEHSLDFDTGTLPKGMYIGMLRTGQGSVVPLRLVVQ